MTLSKLPQDSLTEWLVKQQPLVRPAEFCQSKLISIQQHVNPLVAAAMPLFSVISRIQHCTNAHAVHEQLDEEILHELKAFESQLWQEKIPNHQIYAARLMLCGWIDELMTQPDQPAAHIWKKRPLSRQFKLQHPIDVYALALLDQALLTPNDHIFELELFYMCLSMGYSRLFHRCPHPEQILTNYKNVLYQSIRQHRDTPSIAHKPLALCVDETTVLQHERPHYFTILCAVFFGCLLIINLILSFAHSWYDPSF